LNAQQGWETVVCVASGPSLTDRQCAIAEEARLSGHCRIIVVNNNWARIRSADLLYACDGRWWDVYADAVRAGFRGECWTHTPLVGANGTMTTGERQHAEIIARYPWLQTADVGRVGGNGGAQAIPVGEMKGARRFLLIGYDMKRGPRGEKHHHPDHPKPLTNGTPNGWLRRFDELAKVWAARGLTIVNCSRDTALTCFPRMTLGEALCVPA
jgi:hypothetical protein